MVAHITAWFDGLDSCHAHDAADTNSRIPHREAARYISASQPGSGSWQEQLAPGKDQLHSTGNVIIGLQRRNGLYISDGLDEDPLGDNGDRSSVIRHNGVLRANYDAARAVATGTTIMGDKNDKNYRKVERFKEYNRDHVPDLIEPYAIGAKTHRLKEVKTASATIKSGLSNGCKKMGHIYAFGNTEENLSVIVLGRPKRHLADGAYDPTTGKGYLPEPRLRAQYADALSKGTKVVLLVYEAMGGISPNAMHDLHRMARLANKVGHRDGTVYDHTRPGQKQCFLTHYMQRISSELVLKDAASIREAITLAKIKANRAKGDDHVLGA